MKITGRVSNDTQLSAWLLLRHRAMCDNGKKSELVHCVSNSPSIALFFYMLIVFWLLFRLVQVFDEAER